MIGVNWVAITAWPFVRAAVRPLRDRRYSAARRIGRQRGTAGVAIAIALSALGIAVGSVSRADPAADSDLIRPLPVINPTPTNWTPKFSWPYDQTRNLVTDADIGAERDMCQWFNAQYDTLSHQIDRLQFNRISANGTDFDYGVDGIQHQVDIVTANIDQSLAFLAPRAQALTQSQDFAGDVFFPIYKGAAFYGLWQQLSNVNNGIKAHQPDWFTGPSVLRAKRFGSEINRSHVCD
jgi:hypothetical protein